MASIVTLTMNPAIDISAYVEHVTPDRKLRTDEPKRDPGGGGINVCRAIHRLGGECEVMWTSGGLPGEMLRELLDNDGISQRPIPIRNWTRENTTFTERGSDRQFRFVMPGPELSEEEAQNVLDELARLNPPPDYLVLSGSLPRGVSDDFYARAALLMHDKTRVIVDTGQEALRLAVEAGIYLIKPNLRELSQIVGRGLESEEQIVDAVRKLIGQGCVEVVIVSLGSGGAMLVMEDHVEKVASPTVPIKSRVGAGDSMVAGIVLALSRGEPVERALRFGVAAGAAAVMSPGTELCGREDTERLYEEILNR